MNALQKGTECITKESSDLKKIDIQPYVFKLISIKAPMTILINTENNFDSSFSKNK